MRQSLPFSRNSEWRLLVKTDSQTHLQIWNHLKKENLLVSGPHPSNCDLCLGNQLASNNSLCHDSNCFNVKMRTPSGPLFHCLTLLLAFICMKISLWLHLQHGLGQRCPNHLLIIFLISIFMFRDTRAWLRKPRNQILPLLDSWWAIQTSCFFLCYIYLSLYMSDAL